MEEPSCKTDCTCKEGTLSHGKCKITTPPSCKHECTCPPPSYHNGYECESKVPPTCEEKCICPDGTYDKDGKCYENKPCEGYDYDQCRCPYGYQVSSDGKSCVVEKYCEKKKECYCQEGYSHSGEWCFMKQTCDKKEACHCGEGYHREGHHCATERPCEEKKDCSVCREGFHYDRHDNKCYGDKKEFPRSCQCPQGTTQEGDRCYKPCVEGFKDQGIKDGHR